MPLISPNSVNVSHVANSRRVTFGELPPSSFAGKKLATSQTGRAANGVQTQISLVIGNSKPIIFDQESAVPWFDKADYSVNSAKQRLGAIRQEGLCDFVANTERAKPRDVDTAKVRLGQFLAAKCALAGRLPDGTALGKPMQLAEVKAAVSAALPEVERITLRKNSNIESLTRSTIMGLKQKAGALAHSLDRAFQSPNGGVDADGNRIFDPQVVYFEGHPYDTSDTRTAAMLMLAAMPLDTLAAAPHNPVNRKTALRSGWVAYATCNATNQTVILDRSALWAITSNVAGAEKFRNLSLRFQPQEKAPLDDNYTKQVALHQDSRLVKAGQKTADLLAVAPRTAIDKGKSCFSKMAKSLWTSLVTRTGSGGAISVDTKPVAPPSVDMTSRRSRREAVERIMKSIGTDSPTTQCLDQLLELKLVLNGFDQHGNKVAKDLSVRYDDGWLSTLNLKGYANKSALVGAAEELLEKHSQGLIKIATNSHVFGQSGFSVQNRAKAALVAIPKALLCGGRIASFGFRDHRGLIDSAQQIAQLAQAPSHAEVQFDASVGFKRLDRCYSKSPFSDPQDPFDTLVLLDAVVDYRNAETGENISKDYRSFSPPRNGPVNFESVDRVDSSNTRRSESLSFQTASATPFVDFNESFKQTIDNILLVEQGEDQNKMIGAAIQTLYKQAAQSKRPPESIFNEFGFDKPSKPGEPGPSVPSKLTFDEFMALAQPNIDSDTDSAKGSL